MKMSPLRVMLSTGVLILAACQPATNGLAEAQKGLEKASAEMEDSKGELAKAQEKLATENFSLKDDGSHLPKAELTPDGELLIDGKPVPMNAEQKALGRAYRTQIQSVARDGIAIGLKAPSSASTPPPARSRACCPESPTMRSASRPRPPSRRRSSHASNSCARACRPCCRRSRPGPRPSRSSGRTRPWTKATSRTA